MQPAVTPTPAFWRSPPVPGLTGKGNKGSKPGWLKLEVASLYGLPEYLVMTDDEKRRAKMPVTDAEMRWTIAARQRAEPV